ncbi:hypothetical protein RVM25_34840, partial [Enterobacter hormaechei subsp. xiangfangensis]
MKQLQHVIFASRKGVCSERPVKAHQLLKRVSSKMHRRIDNIIDSHCAVGFYLMHQDNVITLNFFDLPNGFI